jgi:hypothetical protein
MAVDSRYFATLGIPILSGRVFNSTDTPGHPLSVIVNRKMAETLWPGQDPLGRRILFGEPPVGRFVVGVVPNGKYQSLDEPDRLFFYESLAQTAPGNVYLIAKTEGNPSALGQPLTHALQQLHLQLPMAPFTLDSWMNLSLLGERVAAAGISGLGGLGLLLALIGLFASVSWSVTERKKELGIRSALGATPKQLLRMIVRQTALLTGIGIALGTLLGVGATSLLRSLLYGIGTVEWPVLATVSGGMLAVCLAVASLSANPSTKADPMEAVRHA